MELDADKIKENEEEYFKKRSKEDKEEFSDSYEHFTECPLFIREEEKLKRLPNSLSKAFGEEEGWVMNDLVWIAYWKLRAQLLKNRKDDVEKIFEKVQNLDENQVEDKIVELKKLQGVRTAVASAILTFMNPERYTVIDQHAVRALKHYNKLEDDFPVIDNSSNESEYTPSQYGKYLQACNELANEKLDEDCEYPLRTLDRALWKIGRDKKDE